MTDAERQQLSRARKSKAIVGIARKLLDAKKLGDWDAVEEAANALLMF